MQPPEAERGLDGYQLAIINSRLQGVVNKMLNTLVRTGRSGVLNTARDFSCCLVSPDCELLATGESLPIHVMSGPDLMAKALRKLHPGFRSGDAFLHNSPYHGNSHAADHAILIPVMDGGKHRLTVLVKAHQADCGNALPTTYVPEARDLYEEGALIFPMVKIQEDYLDRKEIVRMCEMRIRVPEQWRGDYLAMIGSGRIGERALIELGRDLGWKTIEQYVVDWLNYSETRMDKVIRALPSGSMITTTIHDPFPGVPDGVPLKVEVTVANDEGRIQIDLRDNPDCQPCGLNLTEACSRTAALIGVFNSVDHSVPKNAGSCRRIDVLLRENCIVGIPKHPASCSAATTNLADRVTNCVQRAFAELAEGMGMAEHGFVIPPAWGVLSGNDPRYEGAAFINQIILAACTGGGAGPHADGWLTLGHAGQAGVCFRDSVEMDELRQPILIREQRIIPDSEGAGRFRGAPGAHVEYGPVGGSIEVRWSSDGNLHPPRGARGGGSGSPSAQFKRLVEGSLISLKPWGGVSLEPGETVVSVSTGGGGYGDPMERDPKRVRNDVVEGWITHQRAATVYGVAIAENGGIDTTETRRLRTRARIEAGAKSRAASNSPRRQEAG